MVASGHELAATAQVVSATPGVTELDNQLRVMAGSRLFPSSPPLGKAR